MSSPKSPAFQFYAAEYLADMNVQLLTIEQEGCYIRLLAFCWREGSIPNDDATLSCLCKGCKMSILAPVKRLFDVTDDGLNLIHKRLEKERAKQQSYAEKQSKNGGKGGRPEKAKITQAFSENNPNETQAFSETTEETKPKKSSSFAFASYSSIQELPISPEMVMRGVISELCISGRDLSTTIGDVCKFEMKQGRDATELRDEMISSYRDFSKGRPDMTFPVGDEKFFGQGFWKDRSKWTWKDGKQPVTARKYVNA